MSVTDYVGRTIDLLAYQGAVARGERLLTQELAEPGNSGTIITGIHKLSQRFLLELLTERGSIAYLPARGCDFMTEANRGSWRTPLDIQAAFSASVTDISTNLKNEESSSDPSDERFSAAELVAVSLVAGDAAITIKITSLAGASRAVILPLSVIV